MSVSFSECKYCRGLVPDFDLGEEARSAVFERIQNASRFHCALEVCYWTKCTKEEAETYLDHFDQCLFSWPFNEDQKEILSQIDHEFLGLEKPSTFGAFWHCDECRMTESELQSHDVFSLPMSTLLGQTWCYITLPEAFQYWMPAFVRMGLITRLPNRNRSDSRVQNFMKNSLNSGGFSPSQREAVEKYLNFTGGFQY